MYNGIKQYVKILYWFRILPYLSVNSVIKTDCVRYELIKMNIVRAFLVGTIKEQAFLMHVVVIIHHQVNKGSTPTPPR